MDQMALSVPFGLLFTIRPCPNPIELQGKSWGYIPDAMTGTPNASEECGLLRTGHTIGGMNNCLLYRKRLGVYRTYLLTGFVLVVFDYH